MLSYLVAPSVSVQQLVFHVKVDSLQKITHVTDVRLLQDALNVRIQPLAFFVIMATLSRTVPASHAVQRYKIVWHALPHQYAVHVWEIL